MKLSFKLLNDRHNHRQPSPAPAPPQQNSHNHPLLVRAKIPLTIFSLPFLSNFSTTSTTYPSDLSLSLATNFPSGPSLKLSYSTSSSSSTTTTTTTTNSPPPLTLTLKSGIGVYGSPKESPLVISANFSFSPNNFNSNPTFSLLLKPQFGSFSFWKSTSSNANPSVKLNGEAANSFGFIPIERPMSLKGFTVDSNAKDSIFKGFSVMARTEMPIAKRASMIFRWGMNFPEDLSKQMPYLSVNKFSIQRIDEVNEVKGPNQKKSEGNSGETELLKSMCLWMKREMDVLKKENTEMKNTLVEMRLGPVDRNGNINGNKNIGKNKSLVPETSSGGIEQWRKTKAIGGEESVKTEPKKKSNGVSNVESELERAIKAASS